MLILGLLDRLYNIHSVIYIYLVFSNFLKKYTHFALIIDDYWIKNNSRVFEKDIELLMKFYIYTHLFICQFLFKIRNMSI